MTQRTIEFPSLPPGTILGLNYSGLHDTAIALVAPHGELLFACSLERISRVKQDGRPSEALLYGLDWSNIACVALATVAQPEYDSALSAIHPVALTNPRPGPLAHSREFYEYLETLPVPKHFIDHELSHAASAFWLSGMDESLCFSYDGGMPNTAYFGGIYHATRADGLVALDLFSAARHAKMASLYMAVTGLLGFTPNKHEGKVTGLAALGCENVQCRAELEKLFTDDYDTMERLVEIDFMYSKELPPRLSINPVRRGHLLERFNGINRSDIAATIQAMAEEHVLQILAVAKRKHLFASKNICLAGGLFANVKINQRIKESGFDQIFIAPPMTDDGSALGAALAVASKNRDFAPQRIRHMYWGPSFTEVECIRALEEAGVAFHRVENLATLIAKELAEGRIVGVFQGAMEYGPRALGNRSILSRATDHSINDTLNKRLRRTEFMPFAPIVRAEDAARCFIGTKGAEHAAEFMTITFDCTDETKTSSPAIVHVDGTARPQLVHEEINPLVYEILGKYAELTGIPILINTSFNVHEEPIVCSPEDAIEGFLEASIDMLSMGSGIVAYFSENLMPAVKLLQSKLGKPSLREHQTSALNQKLTERWEMAEENLAAKERVIEELASACDARLSVINDLQRQLLGR